MLAFNNAAIAAATAAWPGGQIHKAGQVPKEPPTPYLVLSVTAGQPGNYLTSGQQGSKKYLLAVQAVGAEYDEVAFAVSKAEAAFEDKSLNVTGFDCGPCTSEDRVTSPVIRDPDVADDDGQRFLTCAVIFPFYAFPEE